MEASWSDSEKRFLIGEMIKASALDIESLIRFLANRIDPDWGSMGLPLGRNMNQSMLVAEDMFGNSIPKPVVHAVKRKLPSNVNVGESAAKRLSLTPTALAISSPTLSPYGGASASAGAGAGAGTQNPASTTASYSHPHSHSHSQSQSQSQSQSHLHSHPQMHPQIQIQPRPLPPPNGYSPAQSPVQTSMSAPPPIPPPATVVARKRGRPSRANKKAQSGYSQGLVPLAPYPAPVAALPTPVTPGLGITSTGSMAAGTRSILPAANLDPEPSPVTPTPTPTPTTTPSYSVFPANPVGPRKRGRPPLGDKAQPRSLAEEQSIIDFGKTPPPPPPQPPPLPSLLPPPLPLQMELESARAPGLAPIDTHPTKTFTKGPTLDTMMGRGDEMTTLAPLINREESKSPMKATF